MAARDGTAQEPSAGLPTSAEQRVSDAVLLAEVPSPDGRCVDALVVNLARARQRRDESEAKGPRNDWLAALGQPGKTDSWFAVDRRVRTGVTTEELVRHTRRLVDQREQHLAMNRAFAVLAGAAREQEDEVRT